MKFSENLALCYELAPFKKYSEDCLRLLDGTLYADEVYVKNLHTDSVQAVASAKWQIMSTVGHIKDPLDAAEYIRDIQYGAMELIGLLEPFWNSANPVVARIARLMYKALSELLEAIQLKHPSYFDERAWLSLEYVSITYSGLSVELDELRDLRKDCVGSCRAFDRILDQLRRHVEKMPTNSHLNYSGVTYLKHTIRELRRVVEESSADADVAIHTVLLEMNFNAPEYIESCTADIEEDLCRASLAYEEQQHVLAEHKKRLRRIVVLPGMALLENRPSARDSLIACIDAECEHLDSNHAAARVAIPLEPGENAVETASGKPIHFKLISTLNVGQWSYVIRALHGTGLIKNNNLSANIWFIATVVKPSTKDSMSINSVRKNVYRCDENDREAVIRIVQIMLVWMQGDDGRPLEK